MTVEEEISLRDYLYDEFVRLNFFCGTKTHPFYKKILDENKDVKEKWIQYSQIFPWYMEAFFNIRHKEISINHKCPICKKKLKFLSCGHYKRTCGNKECVNKSREFNKKNTNLKKYGVDNPFKNEKIKEKIKQTCIKKYGVDNYTKTNEYIEKTKQSNFERFGKEWSSQSEEFQNKIKENCLKKYGVDSLFKSNEIKEKIRETNLKKYGVDNPQKVKEIKEKSKQTCIKKYGVDNPFKNNEIKERIKQTCIEKYGVEYASQNEEIHKKQMETYNSYIYENICFDSSWELAYYIYCKFKKIQIEREPVRLEYFTKKGIKHYYYPDFLINKNELIEIKSSFYLMITPQEKMNCIKENKIKIISDKEIQFYLKWCKENNIKIEDYKK